MYRDHLSSAPAAGCCLTHHDHDQRASQGQAASPICQAAEQEAAGFEPEAVLLDRLHLSRPLYSRGFRAHGRRYPRREKWFPLAGAVIGWLVPPPALPSPLELLWQRFQAQTEPLPEKTSGAPPPPNPYSEIGSHLGASEVQSESKEEH